MSANIAVRGGDVYVFDNGEIERTNENWYFNVKAGESLEDLVQRSFEMATKYIRQLQNSNMTNPLVTLVILDSVVACERGAFEKSDAAARISQTRPEDPARLYRIGNSRESRRVLSKCALNLLHCLSYDSQGWSQKVLDITGSNQSCA